jgi:hypothetical protein
VLILGGGGQVARAVAACVPANHTVLVKTRQELDLADGAAVTAAVAASGAGWVVNGAGYTAVDLAEDQAAQAFAAAGCCIFPPTSCSMEIPAGLIDRAMNRILSVCMAKANSGESGGYLRRMPAPSFCAPRGFTPLKDVILY